MSSVNKVTILGTLGRDPESRQTQAGGKIVNLSVATSERWNDKATGERKESTEWHKVVIMNDKIADVAERYLTKGKQVYLEGKIQTRKWQDQSGQDRYSTEIVIGRFDGQLVLIGGADRPSNDRTVDERRDAPSRTVGRGDSGRAMRAQGPAPDLSDDIPFNRCWEV